MAIDYQAIADAGGIGKGQPKADAKAQRTKAREKLDKAENAKVKARSNGRCEVMVVVDTMRTDGWRWQSGQLCINQATQVHHMIGGHGKRAIGKSLLAEHKQHVCAECHVAITGDVGGKKLHLLCDVGAVPHWTNCYVRVK